MDICLLGTIWIPINIYAYPHQFCALNFIYFIYQDKTVLKTSVLFSKAIKRTWGGKGPAMMQPDPVASPGCALDSTPALGGCVLHMWIESTQLLTSEKAVLLQSWRPHLCGEIEVSVVKPEKKPEGQKDGIRSRKEKSQGTNERKFGPKSAFLTISSAV